MIAYFVWLSAFIFAFLFAMWGKSDWLNLTVKFLFLVMMVFAVIIIYKHTGFTQITFS